MKQEELYNIEQAVKEQVIKISKLSGWGRLFKAVFGDKIKSVLTPRAYKVLEYRFGLEDGITRTLEETAQEFGVTRERIRQLEAKAIEILRNSLAH